MNPVVTIKDLVDANLLEAGCKLVVKDGLAEGHVSPKGTIQSANTLGEMVEYNTPTAWTKVITLNNSGGWKQIKLKGKNVSLFELKEKWLRENGGKVEDDHSSSPPSKKKKVEVSPKKEESIKFRVVVSKQTSPSQVSPSTTSTTTTTTIPAPTSSTKEIFMPVIEKLMAHKYSYPFVHPVDTPGYSDVIKKPMDLKTILGKLKRGEYENGEAFAEDVRLVFNNSKNFNDVGTHTYTVGLELEKVFEREYEKVRKSMSTPTVEALLNGGGDLELDEASCTKCHVRRKCLKCVTCMARFCEKRCLPKYVEDPEKQVQILKAQVWTCPCCLGIEPKDKYTGSRRPRTTPPTITISSTLPSTATTTTTTTTTNSHVIESNGEKNGVVEANGNGDPSGENGGGNGAVTPPKADRVRKPAAPVVVKSQISTRSKTEAANAISSPPATPKSTPTTPVSPSPPPKPITPTKSPTPPSSATILKTPPQTTTTTPPLIISHFPPQTFITTTPPPPLLPLFTTPIDTTPFTTSPATTTTTTTTATTTATNNKRKFEVFTEAHQNQLKILEGTNTPLNEQLEMLKTLLLEKQTLQTCDVAALPPSTQVLVLVRVIERDQLDQPAPSFEVVLPVIPKAVSEFERALCEQLSLVIGKPLSQLEISVYSYEWEEYVRIESFQRNWGRFPWRRPQKSGDPLCATLKVKNVML